MERISIGGYWCRSTTPRYQALEFYEHTAGTVKVFVGPPPTDVTLYTDVSERGLGERVKKGEGHSIAYCGLFWKMCVV